MLDNRGLWIDLEVTYEGLVTITMQTKLNLMKLKQPPPTGNLSADLSGNRFAQISAGFQKERLKKT